MSDQACADCAKARVSPMTIVAVNCKCPLSPQIEGYTMDELPNIGEMTKPEAHMEASFRYQEARLERFRTKHLQAHVARPTSFERLLHALTQYNHRVWVVQRKRIEQLERQVDVRTLREAEQVAHNGIISFAQNTKELEAERSRLIKELHEAEKQVRELGMLLEEGSKVHHLSAEQVEHIAQQILGLQTDELKLEQRLRDEREEILELHDKAVPALRAELEKERAKNEEERAKHEKEKAQLQTQIVELQRQVGDSQKLTAAEAARDMAQQELDNTKSIMETQGTQIANLRQELNQKNAEIAKRRSDYHKLHESAKKHFDQLKEASNTRFTESTSQADQHKAENSRLKQALQNYRKLRQNEMQNFLNKLKQDLTDLTSGQLTICSSMGEHKAPVSSAAGPSSQLCTNSTDICPFKVIELLPEEAKQTARARYPDLDDTLRLLLFAQPEINERMRALNMSIAKTNVLQAQKAAYNAKRAQSTGNAATQSFNAHSGPPQHNSTPQTVIDTHQIQPTPPSSAGSGPKTPAPYVPQGQNQGFQQTHFYTQSSGQLRQETQQMENSWPQDQQIGNGHLFSSHMTAGHHYSGPQAFDGFQNAERSTNGFPQQTPIQANGRPSSSNFPLAPGYNPMPPNSHHRTDRHQQRPRTTFNQSMAQSANPTRVQTTPGEFTFQPGDVVGFDTVKFGMPPTQEVHESPSVIGKKRKQGFEGGQPSSQRRHLS